MDKALTIALARHALNYPDSIPYSVTVSVGTTDKGYVVEVSASHFSTSLFYWVSDADIAVDSHLANR